MGTKFSEDIVLLSDVKKKTSLVKKSSIPSGYTSVLADSAHLLEYARSATVRTTNVIMTASSWEIGCRIVEYEQSGGQRAEYGKELIHRLSVDLTRRFGRGQLDRQIYSHFSERALLSRNKAAMLKKGEKALPADALTPEEERKDPFVLEFLNHKDEYSENDLEEAPIQQLERFLLELDGDFTFVGRQRRLRIGDEWYREDLLFFNRKVRSLVIIDLQPASSPTLTRGRYTRISTMPVNTEQIQEKILRQDSSCASRKIMRSRSMRSKGFRIRFWPLNTEQRFPIRRY